MLYEKKIRDEMKIIKFFIVLMGLATVAFLSKHIFATDEFENVKTVRAKYRDITNTLIVSGVILPQKEIEVKSTISGVLDKLYVQEGDSVFLGQKLASIKYVKAPIEYEEIQKQVKIANAKLAVAEMNFKATKALFQDNVITKIEFEEEKSNYEIIKAEYEAAKMELNMVSDKCGDNDVTNIIRSTGTGIVLELPIKEGGSIMGRGALSEGTTIARIADMQSLIFKGNVLESELLHIYNGMPVYIVINVARNIRLKGIINFISPKGEIYDGISRFTMTVMINIPSKYQKFIKAGCTANAYIEIEKRRQVLSIDEKYLSFGNDSIYVEILNAKQEREKRIVKTGVSDGIYTEILGGLDSASRIIIK